MTVSGIDFAPPDLSVCDVGPITRLERIQSFGFLLATANDWTIARSSANLEQFLGVSAEAAIGCALDSLIDGAVVHEIRNRMLVLSPRKAPNACMG
jgi:light-regulated signal transduction histidine kinase (bacteriophytochrome)